MTVSKLQEHFFRLLCEIDGLCAECGIPYSLAEHSAWDAIKFNEYHGGMYDTCVMMAEDALARFEKELGDRGLANRKVVQDGVGAEYGKSKRYIDTATTLYDFKDPNRYKHAAVGVDIRVLIPSGNDSYETVNPIGKALVLPKTLFGEYKKAEIEGRSFSIVADYDAYFSKLVSKEWRKKNYTYPIPKEPSPAFNLIYSDDLPYTDFFERHAVKRATSHFSVTVRDLYDRWRKERYDKPASALEKKYKKYLTLTEDRFIYWESLYPLKSQLLEMAAANPVGEELRERLKPYLNAIDKHKKKGLGLTFDEEILQITLPILQESKGKAYVEDFLKKIPEAHRAENLDQTLKRKGVNHPLLQADAANS